MDLARRAYLAREIISGLRLLKIQGHRYTLVSPTSTVRLLAEQAYQDAVEEMRFSPLITPDSKPMVLRAFGDWAPEDEVELKKQEKHLEDRKVDLYKAMFDQERIKRTRASITYAKSALNRSYLRKFAFEHATIAYQAQTVKEKFVIAACLRTSSGDPVYNIDSYLLEDSTILVKAFAYLQQNQPTTEEIREIARTDPWRGIWQGGKSECFGRPSCDWTDVQLSLVNTTMLYDNAAQNPECPPEEVIADDDMFDGWLIEQRRTRLADSKKRDVDRIAGIDDRAQEVFLPAATREEANKVYDLNDDEGRRTIKNREAFIEKHGKVDAKDLPDTKLELRRQMIDEYKTKMKRK